eukprot:TRINITY_DN13260_c0_g1_i1.p1 TRINITY_DN13260_c0_g1~~TRINITY_DN13260_c0_g1_i1.p1  ORF type:complete len:415 (-),score=117.93 TRINITY_DN13260_c0_g1_i1:66-1154(-)
MLGSLPLDEITEMQSTPFKMNEEIENDENDEDSNEKQDENKEENSNEGNDVLSDIKWVNGSFEQEQPFQDYIVCGIGNSSSSSSTVEKYPGLNDKIIELLGNFDFLKELEPWNLSGATPLRKENDWKLQVNWAVLPHADPLESWHSKAEPELTSFMQAGKERKLQDASNAVSVKDVTCETVFYRTKHRLVYIPVHMTVFEYKEKKYKFVENAVTGQIYSEKPFGFGSFISKVGKYLSGWWGQGNTSVAMLKGDELCSLDNYPNYEKDSTFLVLPSSDSFLFAQSTGWVALKHTGKTDSNVILESRWRCTEKRGPKYILKPGETLEFNYRGSWVVRVCSGVSNVMVTACETAGGAKGNALGME